MIGAGTRWVAAVLAAGALLATACSEQSRVAPEATITVQGDARATDGAPLDGRPVRLGAGITESEGAFAVLTVGLSCTSGECRGAVRDTTTDSHGRFAFTLEGHETQSSFGEAVSVLVSAVGPVPDGHVSGPLASARFNVQTEQVTLPTLELIDPGLILEGDAGVAARWATNRAAPYELTFETNDAIPVWRLTTAEGTASVDSRVLEDTSGRAVVAGRFDDVIEGSDVEMRWRSPGVGYAAGAGPPPSRGRPCRYLDSRGRHTVESPCGLTDGDFAFTATAPPVCADAAGTEDCEPPVTLELDLGGAVPAELVVVRGCAEGCAVETTADGVTYRPVGAVSDDFGLVGLDGQPATAVRVGLGSSSFGLREVSVWGPRPDRPALRSLDDEAREELGAPFGGDTDDSDGLPFAAIATAAIAAAAVLLGLGFVAGRRRRT